MSKISQREVAEFANDNGMTPAILTALQNAVGKSGEFLGNSGGQDNDSLRGFGATSQAWDCGDVVIINDNTWPQYVRVRTGEGWFHWQYKPHSLRLDRYWVPYPIAIPD